MSPGGRALLAGALVGLLPLLAACGDDEEPLAVDATPPAVQVTSTSLDGGTLSVTVAVTDAGTVETLRYRLGDGPPVDVSFTGSPLTFQVPDVPFGTTPLTATAEDQAGNQGSATVDVTREDAVAPALSLTAPADSAVQDSGTVRLMGTATDANGVSHLEWQAGPATGRVELDGESDAEFAAEIQLPDGAFLLTVTAVDLAENRTGATRRVTVDTEAPVVAAAALADGDTVRADTLRLEILGADALGVASVAWSLDGGSFTTLQSETEAPDTLRREVTLTELEAGEHELVLRATDRAGNRSQVVLVLEADDTDPVLEEVQLPEGSVVQDGPVVLDLEVEDPDDVHRITVRVDGEELRVLFDRDSAEASPGPESTAPRIRTETGFRFELSDLGSGEHALEVCIFDTAGNPSCRTVTVRVDAAAPTVSITEPSPGDTVPGRGARFRATVADSSGLEFVRWRVDDGAWNQVAFSGNPVEFSDDMGTLPEGEHVVTVEGVDPAGNVGADSVRFVARAPSGVLSVTVSPDSLRIPVGDSATLEATVRDAAGNVLEDVSVEWSSEDPEVAQVLAPGLVQGLALRRTRIFASVDGATASVPVVGAPSLEDRAVSVDSTVLDLLSDSTERAQGVYRFQVLGDTSVSFAPGDILVGTQGPGFLREVTRQTRSGSIVEVETEQARLVDAWKANEIHVDMQLVPGGQAGLELAVRQRRADPHIVAGRTAPVGPTRVEYLAQGVSIGDDGQIIFTETFGQQNFNLQFEGSIGFQPRTGAHFAWNNAGPLSGIDSIRVDVGGTATLTAEASLVAQASATFEEEITLTSFSQGFAAPGVAGRIFMDIVIGFRAEASAKGELSTGKAVLEQTAVVGARYKNGSFGFPTDFSTEFEPPTPTFSAEAEARARPYVRADVGVVLYEVVGPVIGPEPYLEGLGRVQFGNPEECGTQIGIYGGLDIRAALKWGKAGKPVKNLLGIPDIEERIQGPRTELIGKRTPCTGDLQVDAVVTGGGTDPDGFVAVVDDSARAGVPVDGAHRFQLVETGDRSVRLEDLDPSCGVEGENPRTVTVRRNQLVRTAFDVVCANADLRVSTSTSGVDPDDGYVVAVNDSTTRAIGPNHTADFDIPAGTHEVELREVAANCAVQGSNPRTVETTDDQLDLTSFEVVCQRFLPGKIAFVSDRDGNQEIYLANADGTDQTRLTDNGDPDKEPAISPDGSRIAFGRGLGLTDDLYVMDADGSNVTQLTVDANPFFGPAWSPDGSRLAFLGRPTTNFELGTMDADGSNRTLITNSRDANERSPSWNADGTRLVFKARNRDEGPGELFFIDDDGSNVESVTAQVLAANHTAWSPTGEWIAFTSQGEIHIIRPDGTDMRQVTTAGGSFPAWSPNGEKLAFVSIRDGDNEIYVINLDGSGVFQVTDNDDSDTDPSWGPAS